MNDPRFFSFWLSMVTILALSSSLLYAHFDHREPKQSYRQSVFALIALNFGPIAAMAKGDIEWDGDKLAIYADELDKVNKAGGDVIAIEKQRNETLDLCG